MNFFEHQDRARRQTRILVLAFVIATIATIVAVDIVLVISFGVTPQGTSVLSAWGNSGGPPPYVTTSELLASNRSLLLYASLAVIAIVVAASTFRLASLKSGGGQIARELGATLVDADARSPQLQRLRNVVEEISLAAGIPVPEIYVLEREEGINAFASGFTSSDAAVTVTRGALEKLSRNELQGVIAHEFSHIFNGDMRINLRLVGLLFGILVISLVGRRIMFAAGGRGRQGGRNGSAVVLFGLAITATGYAGLFTGRLIKSALSRQREYLADASAVQFTRDPSGISGVLKKLAVLGSAGRLKVDAEEISHMLFGPCRSGLLFATHPPVLERIRRLEPEFRAEQLDEVRQSLLKQQTQEFRQKNVSDTDAKLDGQDWVFIDPGRFIQNIGNPGAEVLLAAAALVTGLPEGLGAAARSIDTAPALILYTLLDPDTEIRRKQLSVLESHAKFRYGTSLNSLLSRYPDPVLHQRLPLFELAFPTLKRRPTEELRSLLKAINLLVRVDNRVDTFEFLLSRAIEAHLRDLIAPTTARGAGRLSLATCEAEVRIALSTLVTHGHEDDHARQAAFTRGLSTLGFGDCPLDETGHNWDDRLDFCLARIDQLKPLAKNQLVSALLSAVVADGRVVLSELELVRAMCAAIHIPLPMPFSPSE